MITRSRVGGARETPRLFRRYGAGGALVFERELPILPPHSDGEATAVGSVVRALMPPAAAWLFNRRLEYRWTRFTYMRNEAARMLMPWQGLPFAAVCALSAFALTRRRGVEARATWPWVLLSLAFGLGGLAATWMHSPEVANAACPACGRRRPLARATCPACQSTWPRASLDGTEVMEPAA